MVAYSFKRRFVWRIQVGLGLIVPEVASEIPKRQTIRAVRTGQSRHARAGDMLQLYCGLRTKQCFSIGVARCISVHSIIIWIDAGIPGSHRPEVTGVKIDGKLQNARKLNDFARADGFEDIFDMGTFWAAEHRGVDSFEGVLIKWEPL